MAQEWHYAKGEDRHGPVSFEQLKELAESGELQPSDLVWQKGMEEWQPAKTVEGLFRTELDQSVSTESDQNAAMAGPTGTANATLDKLTGGRVKSGWLKLVIVIGFVVLAVCIVPFLAPVAVIGGIIVLIYYWKRIEVRTRWAGVGIILLLLLVPFFSSSEPPDVTLVKTGHLAAYPNIAVGEAIDEFMANPQWEAITGEDGNRYVNVLGEVEYEGKSVEAALQFRVDRENGTFEAGAFQMNELPQNAFMMAAFISKMFDEYEE